MLEIRGLTVSVQGKQIAKGVDLALGQGEVHVLMGPNGAGKSSVAQAIMGNPKYKTEGKMLFLGNDLAKLKPNERAQKGIFLAFQNPEEIEGVSVSVLLRKAISSITGEKQTIDAMMKTQDKISSKAEALGLGNEFLKRSTNLGFSGGEKKRSEVLQMAVLEPKLMILDEIDSGLDVDGVKLVAAQIKKLIAGKDAQRSILLITHSPRILKYLKPKFVHVMVNGKIVKSGTSKLADQIEKKGYGWIKDGH